MAFFETVLKKFKKCCVTEPMYNVRNLNTPVSGLKAGKNNDCLTSTDECLNGSEWYVNVCAEKAFGWLWI